jgi:hypothetical protein
MRPVLKCLFRNLKIRELPKKNGSTKTSKHTGNLMIYARNVEHAASVKTAFKLMAYESLAASWISGGKLATRRAECRICLINYTNDQINLNNI